MVVGAPTPKARARVQYVADGKVWGYTPEKSKDYATLVTTLAKNKANLEGFRCLEKTKAVRLSGSFVVAGKATSRPDILNLIMQVGDALSKVWYYDDSQIVEVHFWKRQGQHPRCYLKVEEINDQG